MRPEGLRDPIAGPDSGPEHPFPLKLSGEVIKGFGRGSSQLGIPTANIPIEGLAVGGQKDLKSGIYFGWAGLDIPQSDGAATQGDEASDKKIKPTVVNMPVKAAEITDEDKTQNNQEEQYPTQKDTVYPMVMSIGWNPFYKNEKRSVEVHIMHQFPHNFYGRHLNLLILGFIRPEYDYVSKQALVEDILKDIDVAHQSLARSTYKRYRTDPYLRTFPTA